ncbi:hypothetical protein GR702_00980 [Novosphingobium sp. FGD1]|jgi:hypothetical protein|uniref:Lipoprotein n=1 Tax=Novosphingobium silvae TaxID=2692619 RepID=A0A7X4GEM0_9SPHN|nr:hypothetical protein [Novosphingobium silvae]MYL96347.1 hypothetical protein [Novosphingobium silvae]
MMTHARFAMLGIAGTLLLAGCDAKDRQPEPSASDAALNGALGDQIMVDPEMAGGQGAAVKAGSARITVPPQDRTPEAIAAARKQAAQLAGGSLKPAPRAQPGSASALAEGAATAAQVAAASKAARADCSAKVQYSNTWAAKLPSQLPVYPRGAVQEAAGVDADGCALRVVNFVTPVAIGDVVSFYYTKASGAGYSAEYRLDGKDHVLGGRKDGRAYVVYARKLEDGLTEVDLVTSGK